MKTLKTTLICTSVVFSTAASAGWLDFFTQSNESAETVQNTNETINNVNKTLEAVQTVQNVRQNGLVDTLVKRLGVTPTQAQGGSGALFQMAKEKMTQEQFGQISQAVPGMDGLLASVPKQQPEPATGTAGLLSGLAKASGNSTLTSAASLVNTFQQLNLSEGMVSQFTPIVVDYVKQSGGEQLANMLRLALTGS